MKVRFILVRPRDPNNIGAAARALANFGFDDLRVVDPYTPTWQEAKSAVESRDLLPAEAETLDEALKGCDLVLGTTSLKARKPEQAVVALPGLSEFLAERGASAIGVLFGSEKTGLTNEALDRCHALLNIPTDKKQPSMNLAQAVVITAYELQRGTEPRSTPRASRPTAPTDEQMEDLVRKAAEALERLGYRQGRSSGELRRMFRRWRLSRPDAAFLQGLFKRLAD